MKLSLDKVIFINLLFRIFLLTFLLKEDESGKPPKGKIISHWIAPISKRVILIFLNGLDRDFLDQNATPYLSRALAAGGAFGVAPTDCVLTNAHGMQAVVRGRYSPWFPFSWLEGECVDSILDYISFSCAMGSVPPDLSWRCHTPSKNPLKDYRNMSGLFQRKKRLNSLFMLSYDLDPILVSEYRSRLAEIDEDIRGLVSSVEGFYKDGMTTYVVTSARGSPLGKSLSTDVPVLAWGKAIFQNKSKEQVFRLGQTDLAAMLCTLLGTNFPSGLYGIIPSSMMNLSKFYLHEMTFFTVRHFEKVLEIVDSSARLRDASELDVFQLKGRVEMMVQELETEKSQRVMMTCAMLVVLLLFAGVNLVATAACGLAYFFGHLKSLFLLLLVMTTTVLYKLPVIELALAIELLFFCTWQNNKQVLGGFASHAGLIAKAFFATLAATVAAAHLGKRISVPLTLVPVVLWPFIDGSHRNMSRCMLLGRLLSGVVLGALPMNRPFGVLPDSLVTASASFVFLIGFYLFLHSFKREFDTYTRVNFIVILATTIHVCFIREYKVSWLKDILSCLFLAFSFLSAYSTSGTLLEKLSKIVLSLFVPVLMFTVWLECVFYLSAVLHLFTWIVMGYHKANLAQYQFCPPILSIEAKKPLKSGRYSREDALYVVFFLVYAHVSYLAIGHLPKLHSYDFYVVPTFVLQYPYVVSYFLAGFKFFLPLFLVTTSFMTLCLVREKNYKPLLVAGMSASDLIGCFLIVYFQTENRSLRRTFFSVQFTYFVIQQFAVVSVILSYFLGKYLLLDPPESSPTVPNKRDVEQ